MEAETRFLGSRKAKLWTYLIVGALMLVVVLLINVALKNPEAAEHGIDAIAGLPAWAFAAAAIGVGSLMFWLGLKIEADWPEMVGALLIGGGVGAGELIIGWSKFELGGIAVIPYLIPVAIFLVLLIVSMVKSK